MSDFLCLDCGSVEFKRREDDSRRCADCGWLELTPEQIAQEQRWRAEYEATKHLALTDKEFVDAWRLKRSF